MVVVAAIAVRAPLLGTGFAASDTSVYLRVAEGIFHGGFEDNLRPPAYSLLLATIEALGLDPIDGVVLLQNLVGIFLPALVLLCGWRFFSPGVGIVAGFLTAASPLMLITEQLALADYLFGVLLFLGTALLVEAALRVRAGQRAWVWLAATGAVFGLATLFRANGLIGLVAIPIVLFIAAPGLKPGLRSVGATVLAMALVLAPWSLHNVVRFGDPNLATEGGISLYARAVNWDAVPPPDDTPEGALARQLYNTAEPGEPGHPASGQPATALYSALINEGRTPAEAASVMGGLARSAIVAHPGIYLENTWDILRRYRELYDPQTFWANPNVDHIAETTRYYYQYLNLPNAEPVFHGAPAESALPGDSPLTRVPWQLGQALTAILYAITIGGLLSLALLLLGRPRGRLAGLAFLLVLLVAVLGGSLTGVFSQRYDIMLAPFVWLLLAATAGLLVDLAIGLVSSLPRGTLQRWRDGRAVSALRARVDAAKQPFGLSRLALPATAFLAPFSATHVAGPLTVGRTMALALAAALALDVARARPRDLRFGTPALLAGAAYIGLFFWILISVGTAGCNCDGKFGGFSEFAFVGLLGLGAVSFTPELRERTLLALLAGLGLAALLALLGVGALNSGTVDLSQTGGRLSGTYGNANELAFAMAVGVPIAGTYLLAARGRAQLLFGGCFAVLAVALVLSFSRGGIIAAGFGLLAVGLWRAGTSRRQRAITLGAAAAAALVGLALYSVFKQERQEASFQPVPASFRPLEQRDLSGWDGRAIGPIPAGPSRLRNRPSGILVRSDRGGEGASYGWGEAALDGSYELRFRAYATGSQRLPISFALGDGVRGGGPQGQAVLGSRPRNFELSWKPAQRAPHARLFIWQRAGGPAGFVLSDVRVRAQAPGRPSHVIRAPDELQGSLYAHMLARSENEEDKYVSSRVDASKLALEAFLDSPLWGIGWGTFPEYSDEHLEFGRLAAHDEYLSFAAELGLVGLLLLGLLGAAALAGVRRAGRTEVETAAIGAASAAAAGMVFVEALPVPQLAVPVALVVAVLCARRPAPGR